MSGLYLKNTTYWCFQFTGELTDEIKEGLKKLKRKAVLRTVTPYHKGGETYVVLDILSTRRGKDSPFKDYPLDTMERGDWLAIETNTIEGYQKIFHDGSFKLKFSKVQE